MSEAQEMSVEEACRLILGRACADAITGDMGLHWTIVAAMSAATTDDDPRAIATLREHNKRQKATDIENAEHAPQNSDFL